MDKKIKEILNDLYKIDPELKGKEQEIISAIKELINSKPEVEINNIFKNNLKDNLLREFAAAGYKGEKSNIFSWLLTYKKIVAVASVCCLILIVTTIFNRTYDYNDLLKEDSVQTGQANNYKTAPKPETIIESEAVPQNKNQLRSQITKSEDNLSDKKLSKMVKSKPKSKSGARDESTLKPSVAERKAYEPEKSKLENMPFKGLKDLGVRGLGSTKGDMKRNKSFSRGLSTNGGGAPGQRPVLAGNMQFSMSPADGESYGKGGFNTEEYDRVFENDFMQTVNSPLSTFSIDVDTASYSNVRRFLNLGQKPYKDAVRIEEMINYFTYDYPDPKGKHPFSITTETTECPWNKKNKLLMIGLQGKKIKMDKLPSQNLVFLLDVSGSMNSNNKLGLLKDAFSMMVENLREDDRVSIVVYAGAAGLVLPPTSGDQKDRILKALYNLRAGGSTAGGAGINLAYKIARDNFIPDGNNRVILATDGDFNVGPSSDGELIRIIEEKRKQNIFLTVLGFGMGNYKDSKMEKLADKGNGNYAYIDTIAEAKKVLVNELGATLFTIAKDVKIQIEFNPTKVASYRLIGYENRMLKARDFDDDTKDAGEIGAGHSVTALYELILADGIDNKQKNKLKYQTLKVKEDANSFNEIGTVKFRYKKPKKDKSILLSKTVEYEIKDIFNSSKNIRFAAAVAQFGLLLKDSKYKAEANYKNVLKLARESKGKDLNGYRAEMIELVKKTSYIK